MAWLAQIGQWSGYVLWAVLLLGASLLVYLGLGGNFVVLGLALVYAVASGFDAVTWQLLLVLLGIALLGELVEFVVGTFYVARKGASRRAIALAFVGGLAGAAAGAPLLPVAGAILGSFVGAFAGAILGEYWHQQRLEPSLRIGTHAFLGKLAAIFFKHACSLTMIALILRATWPG